MDLVVKPGPPAPKPARLPPTPRKTHATERPAPNLQRTAGFVIGGAGLAALITSAVTGALVLDRKQTVERECGGGLCSDAGMRAADTGQKLAAVSTIAFTVGLAGVASGAYLVVSSPQTPARSGSAFALRLVIASKRGAGHSARGRA